MTVSHKPATQVQDKSVRVCIVGSGTYFLSGISYYTLHLANELAGKTKLSVILLQRLIPVRLYPGRRRAGTNITPMRFSDHAHVFDGIDWFWGINMLKALRFLVQERPNVLLLQWWTGTVLHTYLVLAIVAKMLKARVIIEIHEVVATEEGRMRWAKWYVTSIAPLLMRMSNAFIVHSEYDRALLEHTYAIGTRPVTIIPIGPYHQYQTPSTKPTSNMDAAECCNLLFFGVIRPYKGLEDLIRAFNSIPEDQIQRYWLTIVGETWEGWALPTRMIEQSKYRDRMTFVNRYVKDEEVAAFFDRADIVVLPYHRSSASGPLHVAMSQGLPVVVTSVGGLVEAASSYGGTIFVPPHDSDALREGIRQAEALVGRRFGDPHSWQNSVERIETLFHQILPGESKAVHLA